MQDTTATASAPTKSQQNYERRYGPQAKIALDDLKCCECAYCGRELVGPSHRQYAHQFGMMVAVMVHERPYCPSCSRSATSRTFTCMTCKGKAPCLGTVFISGIPYCLKCSEPAEPLWRNIDNIDRHAKPAPGNHAAAIENLADKAAA